MSTQRTEVVTIHRRIPPKTPENGVFSTYPRKPRNSGFSRGGRNSRNFAKSRKSAKSAPRKICKFSGALKDNRARKVSHFVPTGRVIKYPKKCALFCPPGGGGEFRPPGGTPHFRGYSGKPRILGISPPGYTETPSDIPEHTPFNAMNERNACVQCMSTRVNACRLPSYP